MSAPQGRRGASGRQQPIREDVTRGRGRAQRGPQPPQTVPITPSEQPQKPSPPQRGSPPERRSPKEAVDPKFELRMEQLSLAPVVAPMKRPSTNGGKLGRQIPLRTNHFPILMKDTVITVQQYHVDCTHAHIKLNKEETRHAFWKMVTDQKTIFSNPYAVAFDGSKCAYTCQLLKFQNGNSSEYQFEIELQLDRDDRPSKYTVAMQHVGNVVVDLQRVVDDHDDDRSPIHVIDIVGRQLRLCPYLQANGQIRFVPAGRSFYLPASDPQVDMNLGLGREIWPGYFCAAHVDSNWKPVMVFDSSNTAFYKEQSLIDFMCEILNTALGGAGGRGGRNGGDRGGRGRGGGRGGRGGYGGGRDEPPPMYTVAQLNQNSKLSVVERRALDKELKGLKVSIKSREGAAQGKRVNAVIEQSAAQKTFKMRGPEGAEVSITVAEYFRQKYNYQLKYPNLPCIHIGPRKREIYVPLETCHLKWGQKCNKKLTEEMTSRMIRFACNDAPVRQRRIMQMLNTSKIVGDQFMENFGFRVTGEMMKTTGRILEPPGLIYDKNQKIVPDGGVWQMRNARFFHGADCPSWALLSFLRPDKQADMEHFSVELSRTANAHGMRMAQWPDIVKYAQHINQIEDIFKKILDEARNHKPHPFDLRLIVVALSQKNTQFYSEVKRVAEITHGVMTQCVIAKNVFKTSPQTLGNLVLKINAKLGGINAELTPHSELTKIIVGVPTLFIGVDVTHPGPTDTRSPSIASVVANIDMIPSQFAASVRIQRHRRESIVYLQEAVQERIMAFYTLTKQKPQRIVVYRDGVSEGQFKEVLKEEMYGIRKACEALGPDYKPPITFIIVQKRHHTRFFCENLQHTSGKAQNVPPGTTVDRDCVHPSYFDFYICSHYGIQGTSRPAHYCVLHDDSSMSSDQIQLLTYYLCHIYVRCTRAVSIPAPVYYADKVCTRARYHLVNLLGDAGSDTASTVTPEDESTIGSHISESAILAAVTVREHFNTQMYFV